MIIPRADLEFGFAFVFRATRMTRAITSLLALPLLPLLILAATSAIAATAQAQTAPSAPIITRVIEADFAKEEFTIRWRPPASDGGAPIIGYYIYRSQNRFLDDRDGRLNGDVTRCDELYTVETNGVRAQWRITSGSGFLITDPQLFYTVTQTVSTSGQSYNNCYRWHIIAVNSVNRHPNDDSIIPPGSNEAITDPIFSRGYRLGGRGYAYDETVDNGGTACPAGRFRGYGQEAIRETIWGNVNSSPTVYCMWPDHLYAYDTCLGIGNNEALLLSTGDGTLDYCGIRSGDSNICAAYGFDRNEGIRGDNNEYQGCDGRRCGDLDSLAAYHPDHRECQCIGWAEPTAAFIASNDQKFSPNDCECNVVGALPATCECPAGTEYLPEDHRCGVCLDDEDVLNGECVAGLLAAEVVKSGPNLISIRALLSAGRSADAVAAGGVPLLITAARLGHADVVSVLITAGADPKVTNPLFHDTNVAHMMAASDGGADGVTRAKKSEVLRHFGDALEISGAEFDWNARDGNNNHVTDLMMFAGGKDGRGRTETSDADLRTLTEMTDYMLTKGMNCYYRASSLYRYSHYCIGTLGRALADEVGGAPTLENVRARAQAMKDAGIPIDVAGLTLHGGLVAEAAWARKPEIMAALITFGADATLRGRDWTALHHIANHADAHTESALALLTSFIGALEAAGRFDSFGGWNDGGGSTERPLDDFRHSAGLNSANNAETKTQMHELLYESGARCMTPTDGTNPFAYCAIPTEEIEAETSAPGIAVTVWRPRMAFRAPPSALVNTLAASGWDLAIDTGAEPDVMRLSRSRVYEDGDINAVFAVTLYNPRLQSDADARIVRISAEAVAAPQFPLLLSAILAGDADAMTPYLLPEFTDATTPNGTPLLLTAAALGHARVVSVLVTFGFDPKTRLASFHGVNVAHLMATYDGTPQEGGGELPRADRLNVLRHFGDAIRVRADQFLEVLGPNADAAGVRATLFDWNARTGNNFHLEQLLSLSNDRASAEDKVLIQEMADYMLGQGMHCNTHLFTDEDRFRLRCIGTLGKALADLINNSFSPSAAAVRAAAEAMKAAGIPVTLAGISDEGELLPRAMFRRHWEAVSILITLGFNLTAEYGSRPPLHYVGYHADNYADQSLRMMRHFLGGLYASGRLEEFNNLNGWNANSSTNNPRRALDEFRAWAYASPNDYLAEKWETQALLYEHGARCTPALTVNGRDDAAEPYCQIPEERPAPRNAVAKWEGGILTATARAASGFKSPPVDAAILQSIAANGWTIVVETTPSPDELVLSRTRRPQGNPPVLDPPAVFTLTLTSAAGEDSRLIRISAALAADESQLLLLTAVRDNDIDEVRRLLLASGGAFADTTNENNVPILIEAAALGHAEIVSILVTAGADPNAGHPDWSNRNVAQLMATYDGTPQPEGGELPRAMRATVLYHFGDALKVRGTLFNWNAPDDGDFHIARLLDFSYNNTPFGSADRPILLEMADYMLEQGMNCNYSEARSVRYSRHCVGSLGAVLASLVLRSASSPPTAADIRAAAAAMEARGIPATLAGSASEGALVGVAARRTHAEAISVLVTLGFDPEGENSSGRSAAQQLARDSDIIAPKVLAVLRHFIGGLSVAGKLAGFEGWNRGHSNEGRPLESFNTNAQRNNLALGDKAELHATFYEQGARCAAPEGKRYCQIPLTNYYPLIGREATGAVYTITARAAADFRVPLVGSDILATLTTLGWGLTLNTEAEPEEAILSRTQAADMAGYDVVFTLAMTAMGTVAAEDVHYARVDAAIPNDDYLALLDAVRNGDASTVALKLSALGTAYVDAEDVSGVPLHLLAAGLGHGDVVSVLITFGFDPDARHADYDNGAIPHMMARYDGPDIPRTKKRDVVRHFGDAISVRATLFDWNALDDNDDRMLDLLLAAAQRDGADADPALIGETADYALARDGRCASAARNDRAHLACAGTLGRALASIVIRESPPPSALEIRNAAQAMVDAGISVSVAYSTNGAPVASAGSRRLPEVVSILITFGADPKGVAADTRNVLHYIGRNVDVNPAELVTLLHHFIGGLSVAGKLETFNGWNITSNVRTPLVALANFARLRDDAFAPEREIHSLMYEQGARCIFQPNDGNKQIYCDVPFEPIEPLSAPAVGDGFTVTARGIAGEYFTNPPVQDAAARTALTTSGWTVSLNSGAAPDEVVVSRATISAPTDLPVLFTLILIAPDFVSNAAEEIRHYRITPRPLVEYAVDGPGGALTANVASGARAPSGSTITFTATPTVNFYVSEWRGIDNCPTGGSEAKGAAGEIECARTIEADISVAVVFARDCSTENRLPGAQPHLCGACLDETYQDTGTMCERKPLFRFAMEPPLRAAGTLTLNADVVVESGTRVDIGTAVTFIATPGDGYYVAEWDGKNHACQPGNRATTGAAGRRECVVTAAGGTDVDVLAVFRKGVLDCAGENRHLFGGRCVGCLEGYGELRGLCLKKDGDYGTIPQEDMCRVLGGRFAANEAVCADVDEDGTFCILDSTGEDPAFPCRGLFRRVLHCNLAHHRPGANPFACGAKCDPEQIAQGGECRDDDY